MIHFVERYFEARDLRGSIEGLINFGTWEEVNFITSLAGCTRGNHYHKDTLEAFFILNGRIRINAQRVEGGKLTGSVEQYDVGAGKVFIISPNINHTFYVLEDATWMNFLSKKVDGITPDFHRPQ